MIVCPTLFEVVRDGAAWYKVAPESSERRPATRIHAGRLALAQEVQAIAQGVNHH